MPNIYEQRHTLFTSQIFPVGACIFAIYKVSCNCFPSRRLPRLFWWLVQTLIRSSLYCAALTQQDSSYPCHLLTLCLAFQVLICCELGSFLDAMKEGTFKREFPAELRSQLSFKRLFPPADISKNYKLKIIQLIVKLYA